MTINPETTVADLVTVNFQRAVVFEKFGIDYCCGGNISLNAACSKKGINPQSVQAALTESDSQVGPEDLDWQNLPLAQLARHIEGKYHTEVKTELPRLTELLAHVVDHHGADHPELAEAVPILGALRSQLTSHMATEETSVFPLCAKADEGDAAAVAGARLEAGLRDEHAEVGAELAQMRSLLKDYAPPEGACRKYQAFLHGMAKFEHDMHEHVHLENNILLPRLAATISGEVASRAAAK